MSVALEDGFSKSGAEEKVNTPVVSPISNPLSSGTENDRVSPSSSVAEMVVTVVVFSAMLGVVSEVVNTGYVFTKVFVDTKYPGGLGLVNSTV